MAATNIPQPLLFNEPSEIEKRLEFVSNLKNRLEIWRSKIEKEEEEELGLEDAWTSNPLTSSPNSARKAQSLSHATGAAVNNNLLNIAAPPRGASPGTSPSNPTGSISKRSSITLKSGVNKSVAKKKKRTLDKCLVILNDLDRELKKTEIDSKLVAELFEQLGKKTKSLRKYIQKDFKIDSDLPEMLSASTVEAEEHSKSDKKAEKNLRTKLTHLEQLLNDTDSKVLQTVLLNMAKEDEDLFHRISQNLEKAHKDKVTHKGHHRNRSGNVDYHPTNSSDFEEGLETTESSKKGKHRRVTSITSPEIFRKLNTTTLVKDPVIKGHLQVKDKNKWKRRWVMANEETLYIFKDTDDEHAPMIVSLSCGSVRMREGGKQLQFTLLTPVTSVNFSAESEKDVLNWTATLEDLCNTIMHKTIGTETISKSSTTDKRRSQILPNAITPEKKELLELMKVENNNICADCGTHDPEWVSINLGIFVCIECSGAHRNLGTHISKVRSIQYDHIDNEQLQRLKSMGNQRANKMWEGSLPPNTKPTEKDPLNMKGEYIRAKYAEMKYIDKSQKEELLKLVDFNNENGGVANNTNQNNNSTSTTTNNNNATSFTNTQITPTKSKDMSETKAIEGGGEDKRAKVNFINAFRKSSGNMKASSKPTSPTGSTNLGKPGDKDYHDVFKKVLSELQSQDLSPKTAAKKEKDAKKKFDKQEKDQKKAVDKFKTKLSEKEKIGNRGSLEEAYQKAKKGVHRSNSDL